MDQKIKYRLIKTTAIFWLLLLYILAALVWWYISLERQNQMIYNSKLHELELTVSPKQSPELYQNMLMKLKTGRARTRTKNTGEGSVFLFFIMIGAYFILRSVRQQIKMQQQQQNFMMAVTHELKTPIAVAKLNIETLLKYNLDTEKQKKLLQITLDETKRLDILTNNILTSAQLESTGFSMNKEDLDLSHLLQDRVAEFSTRFPERHFVEDIEPDADITGDPMLLQIMINNLLENAIKYSEKNTTITAVLKKESDSVVLQIKDEGSGVPEEEKGMIFNKFYRLGNEATRKKKGTGLGLFLCKKIVNDHDGRILVKNNIPRGSIFEAEFRAK
jgi:two-component system, OmpR family, sensor histidine kinase CiaH